uniref:Uncharacterized protein n=1 Tax=Arundo donax TaxID=35708 RepID=A0A0A9BD15_ARUDO
MIPSWSSSDWSFYKMKTSSIVTTLAVLSVITLSLLPGH